MRYLLDSNTLIEAKNRYYHMAICPGYWQWILHKNQTREIGSITMIADELLRGDDELRDWAADHAGIFVPITDAPTQEAFATVAAQVAAQSPRMKVGALEDFLSGADPWLIAKAMVTGAAVVTHEAFNPDVKRKFLIPNVCRHFGVQVLNTFELLHTLKAEFVLPG